MIECCINNNHIATLIIVYLNNDAINMNGEVY